MLKGILEKIDTKATSSIIIGIAIVITSYILGSAFKNRNENLDSISVVGLGTKDFVSDEILWTGSFSTKSNEIKEAYNKIISDQICQHFTPRNKSKMTRGKKIVLYNKLYQQK